MNSIPFDTLGYAKKLEEAGFTRPQAEIQAEMMRSQNEAWGELFRNNETAVRKELATKGDLRETELRLQKEIEKVKYDLLKWQIGGFLALAVIMAKGFGWLGF